MLDPQLVDQCIHFPALCVDGSQPTDKDPAVETHIELPGDYHVYLSKRLVVASARLYGMLDHEESSALASLAEQYAAKVAELETELAEAQPVLNAMAKAAAKWGDTEADDEPIRKQAA